MPKSIALGIKLVMENWPVSKKCYTVTKNPLLISKSLSEFTSLDVLMAERIVTMSISNSKGAQRIGWSGSLREKDMGPRFPYPKSCSHPRSLYPQFVFI